MTTKPKAKKFRIRRSDSLGTGDRSRPDAEQAASPAATANVVSKAQVSSEEAIAKIRREGLTGRQLRMARRVAQKHGLAPTSDFDAVRLLREKDIDPFQKANVLELVAPNEQPQKKPEQKVQLPQTIQTEKQALPSTQFVNADERASEILKIQRNIARRRRAKLMALWARLAFFILLPTFIAGWYFYNIATPMYATKSEFVIQTAEGQVGSGLGGLFQGTGLATQQDSVTVQSYLQSRDAMLRLDEELGFIATYEDPDIDSLQRLEEGATNEGAYKLYKKMVKVGYDPTEGLLKMEVIAPSPDASLAYSNALVGYAEEQVDNLTSRVREQQLKVAKDSLDAAEVGRREAQAALLEAQQSVATLSPEADSQNIYTQIAALDSRIIDLTLQLRALEANARPNQGRVDGVRADINRANALRDELRAQLTDSDTGNSSLAVINSEIIMLQSDLETRNLMLQQAMATFETALIESTKQVRYLSMGVSPVAPDEPTYPKSFENTAIAFLIFSGIYLMISLTAGILREQVSS